MLKQKWYFSFARALLVLWSYSSSGLDNLLLQTAFQQYMPLAYRKTLSCNRKILATLTVCVQEELELTLQFVYVRYITAVCALAILGEVLSNPTLPSFASTERAGMCWPFWVQLEGIRFSKVTFC